MSLKRKFKFEDVEEGKSLQDYKAFGESIFLSFYFFFSARPTCNQCIVLKFTVITNLFIIFMLRNEK